MKADKDTKMCFTGPLPETTSDEKLYEYFLKNIYDGDLKLYGTPIRYFTAPVEDNKIQSYFHLTTRTQYNFGIKLRMKEARAYFINYVPQMINNFENCEKCKNTDCHKIKIWTAPYKNTKRIKLLYTDKHYSYIIILERKKKEIYLVTSYLIDDEHYLDKILKEYNEYK